MKNRPLSLALGLAALVATEQAHAAPIDVVTAAPVIDVPVATADYLETFGAGDFAIFDAGGTSIDLAPTGPLSFDILFVFEVADPSGTIEGSLSANDDNGLFIDGVLVRTGFDDDVLQLLFGDLTGSAAADFGEFALTEITFIDPFPGTDPLSNLVDGTTYDVAATVSSVAPVPLPAALPLLLAGLGGLALMRRRG